MNRHWRNLIMGVGGAAVVIFGAACGSDEADPKVDASAPKAAVAVDPKAGWPKQFHIGLFGGDDAEEVLRKNDGIKAYLEKNLGVEVKLTTGTSYGAVIEAMRAKRVDAMVVGPFSYLLAVQEAGAEALAVYVGCGPKDKEPVCKVNPTAKPYYQSVVFTKKGNGITKVEDLKGKGFAFVDPASTSGHLAPKTILIKSGYANPDKDLQTVFAGSHPTAALAVYNGKTPAGGTHEGNLRNLIASKQVEACLWADGKISEPRTAAEIKKTFDECPNGKLAILAVSDPIPSTPFAIRGDLPDSFKKAVKDALLQMKDDAPAVEKQRAWYVDPSGELGLKSLDAFYNSLRDIAKLLNLDLKSLD